MPTPAISIDDDAIVVSWAIVQGNDVNRSLRIRSDVDGTTSYWDLTGYTISGQVRVAEDSDSTLLGSIVGTPHATQSGDTKGQFSLTITRSATAGFPRRCFGDVIFTSPDEDTRGLMHIVFTVRRSVTP